MLFVSRPARAMGTSGSPPTALAYQRLSKPSCSARLACSIMASVVAAPPVRPILTDRRYRRVSTVAVAARFVQAGDHRLRDLRDRLELRRSEAVDEQPPDRGDVA